MIRARNFLALLTQAIPPDHGPHLLTLAQSSEAPDGLRVSVALASGFSNFVLNESDMTDQSIFAMVELIREHLAEAETTETPPDTDKAVVKADL